MNLWQILLFVKVTSCYQNRSKNPEEITFEQVKLSSYASQGATSLEGYIKINFTLEEMLFEYQD